MLTWNTICKIGEHDKLGRWYPCDDVAPYSYAKAAQTKKFALWLLANRPDIAARLGVTV
jgi:hypothetical protein